jgi:hypothetical protein
VKAYMSSIRHTRRPPCPGDCALSELRHILADTEPLTAYPGYCRWFLAETKTPTPDTTYTRWVGPARWTQAHGALADALRAFVEDPTR